MQRGDSKPGRFTYFGNVRKASRFTSFTGLQASSGFIFQANRPEEWTAEVVPPPKTRPGDQAAINQTTYDICPSGTKNRPKQRLPSCIRISRCLERHAKHWCCPFKADGGKNPLEADQGWS
jgi:hypothetical protein